MAQDCYQLFKSTFSQAKADGFSDAVATAAAQSAMDNCLSQQALQVPAAQPIVSVPQDISRDPGPTVGGTDRGGILGTRPNQKKGK